VNFASYLIHVAPGVVLVEIAVFYFLKYFYRKKWLPMAKTRLLKEIDIWRSTAESLEITAGEEERLVKLKLAKYIDHLKELLQKDQIPERAKATPSVQVQFLIEKYKIKNKVLFAKSGSVLFIVVFFLFFNSFLGFGLNPTWITLLGAMLILILIDVKDITGVMEKIELGTLLFFAGLFVMMNALEELGVLEFFADYTALLIETVPPGEGRLAVAVVLVIWVGGTVGAFIDNIPFTQTMIPVIVRLSAPDIGLPIGPLAWALAYGGCMGGNATLIGASPNVVAAGLAEQQGHKITFLYFLKIGFPVMVISLIIVTVYMLITHVLIPWY